MQKRRISRIFFQLRTLAKTIGDMALRFSIFRLSELSKIPVLRLPQLQWTFPKGR
jgi:hypothetical protein